MDQLRKPFFIAAVILLALTVLMEIGSLAVIGGRPAGSADILRLIPPEETEIREAFEDLSEAERRKLASQDKPPGIAITYLALLDGLVLFTIGLIGISLFVPEVVHGKVQGIATLIFALIVIIAGIAMIFVAVAALMLMVSLFLAVPFGTLAYLAGYGFFNTAGAQIALGLLMSFKLGAAVCLVVAQQRFLQNKGLVLLILTALLGNVIISFLHGLVPGFLVSITDAIAAIIVAILAVIWAVFLLIGSIPAIIKTVT